MGTKQYSGLGSLHEERLARLGGRVVNLVDMRSQTVLCLPACQLSAALLWRWNTGSQRPPPTLLILQIPLGITAWRKVPPALPRCEESRPEVEWD